MYPQYEFDQQLVKIHPSPRQLALESMEFYAFVCYTVNSFTDKEWGDGTESPSVFAPTEFDADAIVADLKLADIRGVILTCKHHDGFCLWPSAVTEHTVKHSPFRDGRGDMVREMAEACARGGLKFGVYLSPWDRNCPAYGQGKAYDDFFCAQLTELLTNYGEIFTVWFDGACGEGPNGKRQVYDFERYYALIRELQPNACISICGPDIRWCGNEAGDTRESEWSVLPTSFMTPEEVAASSQQADTTEFREKKIDCMARDLGSRDFLRGAKSYRWYPSETDTSIRPGWFYHASEDDRVRSPETLIDIWYRTVGGNSTLLLNIPPDRRGLFHENDVRNLKAMGDYIRKTFAVNLAANAVFTADKDDGYHTADALATESYDAYYKPFDGENTATVTIQLDGVHEVTHVVMKEHIPMSQRVESFVVEALAEGGEWVEVTKGTIIGRRRITKFDAIKTDTIRIRITDSRVCPILSFVGVY